MDGAGAARVCGFPVGLTVGNIQNRRARKDSQTEKSRSKAQRREGGPEFEQRGGLIHGSGHSPGGLRSPGHLCRPHRGFELPMPLLTLKTLRSHPEEEVALLSHTPLFAS